MHYPTRRRFLQQTTATGLAAMVAPTIRASAPDSETGSNRQPNRPGLPVTPSVTK
ncbi:MAG: twin-arginine translocation signal domain-containing protein [Pirellulaceae bacterium]